MSTKFATRDECMEVLRNNGTISQYHDDPRIRLYPANVRGDTRRVHPQTLKALIRAGQVRCLLRHAGVTMYKIRGAE